MEPERNVHIKEMRIVFLIHVNSSVYDASQGMPMSFGKRDYKYRNLLANSTIHMLQFFGFRTLI